MDYTEQDYERHTALAASQARVGGSPPSRVTTAVQAPLHAIQDRINGAAQRISHIAELLGGHADRAFGERPEADSSTGQMRPCRSGQVGAIEDSLDLLEESISRLDAQADRNCRLV